LSGAEVEGLRGEGLEMVDAVWDAMVFMKSRQRQLDGELALEFSPNAFSGTDDEALV
jgi:hypothetical protein